MLIYNIGQDEAIYKAYQRGKMSWIVEGAHGLRKKGDGPGCMVSAFQDEIRGFGFPMTDAELAAVNQFRARFGRSELTESPGVRYLNHSSGENKEGWWDWEKFEVQLDDMLDCFEVLYPDWQLKIEIDWSSGHAKYREGALNAKSMNAGWGGTQPIMRDSALCVECINLAPIEAPMVSI